LTTNFIWILREMREQRRTQRTRRKNAEDAEESGAGTVAGSAVGS
jgi:hypothetical protein